MIFLNDHRLSEILFRSGTGVPRPFWKLLELTGDGVLWLALCAAAFASPRLSPSHCHLWVNFFIGLIIDLIEVGLLKAIVARERPSYNLIANDMKVIVAVDHYSFPSGHSSR